MLSTKKGQLTMSIFNTRPDPKAQQQQQPKPTDPKPQDQQKSQDSQKSQDQQKSQESQDQLNPGQDGSVSNQPKEHSEGSMKK